MQMCPHHPERPGNFVCSVCTRYFCEECVSERYYPRFAYICHHCSGEKPFEPPPEPEAKEAEEQLDERVPLNEILRRWLVPGIEWVVLGLCLLFVIYRVSTVFEHSVEKLVLASDAPEDLAVYCLGTLDNLEYQNTTATFRDIRAACPFPLEVTEEDGYVLVVSPDADAYGFMELEVELSPVTLTIMEDL